MKRGRQDNEHEEKEEHDLYISELIRTGAIRGKKSRKQKEKEKQIIYPTAAPCSYPHPETGELVCGISKLQQNGQVEAGAAALSSSSSSLYLTLPASSLTRAGAPSMNPLKANFFKENCYPHFNSRCLMEPSWLTSIEIPWNEKRGTPDTTWGYLQDVIMCSSTLLPSLLLPSKGSAKTFSPRGSVMETHAWLEHAVRSPPLAEYEGVKFIQHKCSKGNEGGCPHYSKSRDLSGVGEADLRTIVKGVTGIQNPVFSIGKDVAPPFLYSMTDRMQLSCFYMGPSLTSSGPGSGPGPSSSPATYYVDMTPVTRSLLYKDVPEEDARIMNPLLLKCYMHALDTLTLKHKVDQTISAPELLDMLSILFAMLYVETYMFKRHKHLSLPEVRAFYCGSMFRQKLYNAMRARPPFNMPRGGGGGGGAYRFVEAEQPAPHYIPTTICCSSAGLRCCMQAERGDDEYGVGTFIHKTHYQPGSLKYKKMKQREAQGMSFLHTPCLTCCLFHHAIEETHMSQRDTFAIKNSPCDFPSKQENDAHCLHDFYADCMLKGLHPAHHLLEGTSYNAQIGYF